MPFYQPRPDLKQAVLETIQEIMSDLEDWHKNISDHAPTIFMREMNHVVMCRVRVPY